MTVNLNHWVNYIGHPPWVIVPAFGEHTGTKGLQVSQYNVTDTADHMACASLTQSRGRERL